MSIARASTLVVVLVVSTNVRAEGTLSTDACPRLFGSKKTRARNRAYRERFLRWTRKDPSGITVAHSHQRWEKVVRLKFKGMALERRQDKTLIRLSAKLARRLGCAAGRYLLARDDALGRGTRTLALMGDVVLVAHDGKLAFLTPPESPSPRWLLAWQLQGATVHASARGRSPSKPPPRRPPPPRPPPRRVPSRPKTVRKR